ncbi:HNH endonuclease [Rhizobium leguminosarum]|uniref:HNH endonuclease n=1 Tax=Rhizobium leguminosarum TaxID=384 RepID=UPI001442556C|nr:HNH endonuclease [Rhizobium leguminosarum]MBY5836253.1 HNH endonuclease [Rhizobium leguminosarum]NKM81655.1 HNH endonuclease [Rhizobium leguminosarum bv. viciae]QSZ08573.1 HNH endonuclease [Rhizobium leguminosarum]
MRSLPRPNRDDVRAQLERALEIYERKGVQFGYAVSPEQLDSLIALYDAYDGAGGSPNDDLKGPLLGEDLKVAIHTSYRFTQAGGKLEPIRTSLMRDVEHCPICGITGPRELDHYLPQSAYRPLAIYVRNLVPLCHDCNQSKSTQEAGQPENQFVHPYFEELPDVQFLRATVNLGNGALTIDYDIDPGADLPDILRARLSFQLERLKLNQRYQREINTYLTSHAVMLATTFEAGAGESVSTFLNRQANVERRAFHRNHWRPVLLSALADHEGFCNGGFQDVLPGEQD